MTPILSKTETTTAYGFPVKLIGETYEEAIKKTQDTMIHTVIKIQDDRGATIHPEICFTAQFTEHELDHELKYIKNKMAEKPEIYFPNYVKKR